MYIAYLDESGVVEPNAGTSHFVLVALVIPAATWKAKDQRLQQLKNKHRLGDVEVHTGWMVRRYPEQERIAGFAALNDGQRRVRVTAERKADLAKAQLRGQKAVKELAKNYRATEPYIHLTHAERIGALEALADEVGGWNDCRLFGDAQLKAVHIGEAERIREFAFEQVVTRFQTFLSKVAQGQSLGLLVHDQNQTASIRLTDRMRAFHKAGTAFARIPNIVETPLFVDSKLTSMVQVADLACYATRRFIEKQEADLFDRLYSRYDRANGVLVGLRHFTGPNHCRCRVCTDHQRKPNSPVKAGP